MHDRITSRIQVGPLRLDANEIAASSSTPHRRSFALAKALPIGDVGSFSNLVDMRKRVYIMSRGVFAHSYHLTATFSPSPTRCVGS